MDTSFEEKVIEAENNHKYYVLKQLIVDNNIYLLANILEDEDTPGSEFIILRLINSDKGLKVATEEDSAKLSFLLQRFYELL